MPPYVPIEKRFWKYVQKTDCCWIWTGSKSCAGYGQLSYQESGKQKRMDSHRLSYKIHKGDIPKGMCVCHSCDNPSCVNPGHLWLGTKGQNSKDMANKKRQRGPKGESHPFAKLTASQVEEIKNRLTGKWGEHQILAKEFGVSDSTISSIKCGVWWKHIKPST